MICVYASPFVIKKTGETKLKVVFIDEEGNTKTFNLKEDERKGFDPSMLGKFSGKKLVVNTTVKSYEGRTYEALVKVAFAQ